MARLAMTCGPAPIGQTGADPSRSPAYFAPVIAYLKSRPEPARVEIPFTRSHWEAAFVAPQLALARGWERQLDVRYDGVFYRRRLTPAAYHGWLRRMAVRYVALPDVPLDAASRGEAALLRHPPRYLTPVFRSPHWIVWRVVDSLHAVVDVQSRWSVRFPGPRWLDARHAAAGRRLHASGVGLAAAAARSRTGLCTALTTASAHFQAQMTEGLRR